MKLNYLFNFVSQTKRKILLNIKLLKMEQIEIIKKIDDCINGLNGIIADVNTNAKKISKVCKLRRELTELRNEIEKKDTPQNN